MSHFSSSVPISSQGIILGMPWLVMEDPDISWRNRTVVVQQKGSFVHLPVLRPAHNIPQVNEINMCSVKQILAGFGGANCSTYSLGSSKLSRGKQKIQENL